MKEDKKTACAWQTVWQVTGRRPVFPAEPEAA